MLGYQKIWNKQEQCKGKTILQLVSGTDSNVFIGWLSAVEVVLGEELGQLRLDAAKGLVLAMKQHHQVWHGERLAHQHQQLSKKTLESQ